MPATAPPPAKPTAPPTGDATYNPADHVQPNAPRRAPVPGLADALNKLANKGASPSPAPNLSARSEPPKPEPATPATEPKHIAADDDQPAPHVKFIASDEQDAPAAAIAPEPEAEPIGAKNQKAAFERVTAERNALRSERDLTRKEAAEYKAKLADLEARYKAAEAAEVRAKELEGKVTHLDEQLRVTNYLQHPEFHERYVKPVADAVNAANELIQQLTVEDTNGHRQATADDFAAVLRAPNLQEATRRAKERFGDDPTIISAIIGQRTTVMAAERARSEAMKNAAKASVDWMEQRTVSEAKQRTEALTQFNRVANELGQKYASVYLPDDKDPEAVAARKAGEAAAAPFVLGTDQPLPPDQYHAGLAKVYHRAAAFPLMELKYRRLEAEHAALKAKLTEYEQSTPDVQSRKSDGSTPAIQTTDMSARLRADLEKLAAKSGRR